MSIGFRVGREWISSISTQSNPSLELRSGICFFAAFASAVLLRHLWRLVMVTLVNSPLTQALGTSCSDSTSRSWISMPASSNSLWISMRASSNTVSDSSDSTSPTREKRDTADELKLLLTIQLLITAVSIVQILDFTVVQPSDEPVSFGVPASSVTWLGSWSD